MLKPEKKVEREGEEEDDERGKGKGKRKEIKAKQGHRRRASFKKDLSGRALNGCNPRHRPP